jgi:hypothetical protein
MMVWRNHFVPTMTRAINNDAMPLGALLGSSIFYGMMIVQLKALLKGEEAYNLEGEFFGLNGELLARSAFQSGFAGLLGDFMFKDPEAYGRNLAAELLGPGVSTGSAAAMEMAKGLHYLASSDDDKNWDWGATIRAGKPFVPLHTLWYLRATLDHMLWDIGTAALDDDYYTNTQRRNKDMQEERGGAGWWPKGENIPVGLR